MLIINLIGVKRKSLFRKGEIKMYIDITKIKGLSTEVMITLSACIDKMEISQELKNLEIDTGDEKKDNEELGKQLIVLIITRLHKAREEIYEMVSLYKGISFFPKKIHRIK